MTKIVAYNTEPLLLKNCNDMTMQLDVKYLFPTSFSGANSYIYELPEGLGMRKTLAHGIRMEKNQKPGRIFSGFSRVLMELCGSKVQLAPPQENFINGVSNPEAVNCQLASLY